MSTGILPIVKTAALEAVEATNPVKVVFGTVTKAKPLEVKLDSNMTLSESAGQLKLTRNVTDYEVEMTVDQVTESYSHSHTVTGETSSSDTHTHKFVGKKKFKVHNALSVGDVVLMLKMQGGQAYVVLDKVG